MQQRRFQQVDVFTSEPYRGNPVAVVLDGQGLSDEQMRRFAHWTNLSETTFLCAPTEPAADYRVRIFTPGGELPFAGHPTLGSCHAWLAAGGKPKAAHVVQECAIGLVAIRQQGRALAFAAPPLAAREPDAQLLASVLEALGIGATRLLAAQLLDNGPRWLGLLLDSAEAVLALNPDHTRLKALGQKVGVAGLYAEHDALDGAAPLLEVRAFAAAIGIPEDPVTGSLNASLAQWLIPQGRLPARYVAAQGERLGRAGRVQLERDEGAQVWVGGESVTCIAGDVRL